MQLSDMDKEKLRRLNNELKSIFLQQMASPHNFENHVRCLNHLQRIYDNCFLMMSKYKKKVSDESRGKGLFHRLFTNHVEKKSSHLIKDQKLIIDQNIVEECQSILFNKAYFDLKHQAFASQAVAGLNVYYGLDRNEQAINRGIFLGKTSEIVYEIQFSDGTSINWKDMNDEHQLGSAKMYFEQKMQQVRQNHGHDNEFIHDDDNEVETCLIL